MAFETLKKNPNTVASVTITDRGQLVLSASFLDANPYEFQEVNDEKKIFVHISHDPERYVLGIAFTTDSDREGLPVSRPKNRKIRNALVATRSRFKKNGFPDFIRGNRYNARLTNHKDLGKIWEVSLNQPIAKTKPRPGRTPKKKKSVSEPLVPHP